MARTTYVKKKPALIMNEKTFNPQYCTFKYYLLYAQVIVWPFEPINEDVNKVKY